MEKNSHLKDLQALGPLEVFRADLEEEGSFDDAVAGCDYVFLVAAPMNINAKNPEVQRPLQPPKLVLTSLYSFVCSFVWLYSSRILQTVTYSGDNLTL